VAASGLVGRTGRRSRGACKTNAPGPRRQRRWPL